MLRGGAAAAGGGACCWTGAAWPGVMPRERYTSVHVAGGLLNRADAFTASGVQWPDVFADEDELLTVVQADGHSRPVLGSSTMARFGALTAAAPVVVSIDAAAMVAGKVDIIAEGSGGKSVTS